MTQEELREYIKVIRGTSAVEKIEDKIIEVINQHVAEVIGEDEEYPYPEDGNEAGKANYIYNDAKNLLRSVQRKRAGLK